MRASELDELSGLSQSADSDDPKPQGIVVRRKQPGLHSGRERGRDRARAGHRDSPWPVRDFGTFARRHPGLGQCYRGAVDFLQVQAEAYLVSMIEHETGLQLLSAPTLRVGDPMNGSIRRWRKRHVACSTRSISSDPTSDGRPCRPRQR
jgi:hypothetical protein